MNAPVYLYQDLSNEVLQQRMEILGEHKYDAHQCMHTAIQTWISFIGSDKVESGVLILYNNMFIKLRSDGISSALSKSENVILPTLTFWESRESKPKLGKKNLFYRESQDISDLWVLRQSIMRKTVWAVNYCFGHVLLISEVEKTQTYAQSVPSARGYNDQYVTVTVHQSG